MKTIAVINDSEQRRVKQTLALNSLQRAAQPIEMITVNSKFGIAKEIAKAGLEEAATRGLKKAIFKKKPTANKWSAVGKAAKLATKALTSGKLSRAGRIAKGGLKEAWRSKGAKTGAMAAGGGLMVAGVNKTLKKYEKN